MLSGVGPQKLDGVPPERLEPSPGPVLAIPMIGAGDRDVLLAGHLLGDPRFDCIAQFSRIAIEDADGIGFEFDAP